MITLETTFQQRKKEIEDFIGLMFFLERKRNIIVDDVNEFDKFFYSEMNEEDDLEEEAQVLRMNMSYQDLINILKSNVSLMIYNIIEYTVTNLIECIYDQIRGNHLDYLHVSESLKMIWRKTVLKSIQDPNANQNTFLKKNEEIINAIINKTELDIHARNSMPAGNLDGISIKETMESHGVHIRTNSRNYRPDILERIKERRNNLAHGTVSFIEAVRENTINEIYENERCVVAFLEELIESVKNYLDEEKYKVMI